MNEPCPRCGAKNATGRLGVCPVCMLEGEGPPAVIGDGRLAIEDEIGRGGMGAVYRARHLRLGRTVAVKFLPEALASRPEFQARFEREARALGMLNHPHIVTIHDFGQEGNEPYIVMEYVPGGALASRMPLPVPRAIEIGLQVCDALEYAHRQGVVHRDVKPENVLLDAEGHAKVSDFGIARILAPEGRGWTVTARDQAVGTPHYMAPECLEGAPPDPRMDIFSVGVLLYQMTTGRLPVGDYAPAPPPLEGIVRRALAPDPSLRTPSAQQLGSELREALRSIAVTGEPVPPAKAPAAKPTTPAPSSGTGDELPADEKTWLRIVALLLSVATAVGIWAFIECLTPRVYPAGEPLPWFTVAAENRPDGGHLTRIRFEMWWTMGALLAFALALASYGLLRSHWRRSGLERPLPDREVPEARWVFAGGILAVTGYGVVALFDVLGMPGIRLLSLMPGAALEISMLFLVWVTLLECHRRARSLLREPLLWIGFGLTVLPPTIELVTWLARWTPT